MTELNVRTFPNRDFPSTNFVRRDLHVKVGGYVHVMPTHQKCRMYDSAITSEYTYGGLAITPYCLVLTQIQLMNDVFYREKSQ